VLHPLCALDHDFIQLTRQAIQLAQRYHKPVVVDPVGCGATTIRTQLAREFVSHADIVRGNASEIIALGQGDWLTKGVDSVHNTEDAIDIADHIAKQTDSAVVVSGASDYVTDGLRVESIRFGAPIMTQITGMGCSLTAVIAAMVAVTPNAFEAGVVGVEYFSLCGQLVSKQYTKPGSFKSAFIDMLHSPDFDAMSTLYDSRR
jgi:hydroxyethylthiazole kinase